MTSNRRGFTLIELMMAIVIVSILTAIFIPGFINMQTRAKEARVKHNCYSLQTVAEHFFMQNDGKYPRSLSDQLPDGTTFLQMLSYEQALVNPFTEQVERPIDGVASKIGQIGYTTIDSNGDGIYDDGYEVTGFGKKALIVTLRNGQ